MYPWHLECTPRVKLRWVPEQQSVKQWSGRLKHADAVPQEKGKRAPAGKDAVKPGAKPNPSGQSSS